MDFFILGNPRSGTTLLRLILNAHPKIGVPPECGMIQWWHEKYKNWGSDDTQEVDQFKKDILSSKKIEDWDQRRIQLDNLFTLPLSSYAEVFTKLYQSYTGKPIVGDKNNYYINHLELIGSIYPTSKYIHLVRDGRDVACSYKGIKELDQSLKYLPNVPFDIKSIADEWRENIINVDEFGKRLADNFYTIKYEDILVNPKEEIEALCDFLEVNFNHHTLEFHRTNDEPKSMLNWKQKTLQPLDEKNFGMFRNKLSEAEILVFNKIAGNQLKYYGYEA